MANPMSYAPPDLGSYLDLSWEGDGVVVDGMQELAGDGVKTATLRLTKRSNRDNSAQVAVGDNDAYRVCVQAGHTKPNTGKVLLINGTVVVNFVPAAADKGVLVVELVPVSGAVAPKQSAKLSLI